MYAFDEFFAVFSSLFAPYRYSTREALLYYPLRWRSKLLLNIRKVIRNKSLYL